jgi:hypothetical protein
VNGGPSDVLAQSVKQRLLNLSAKRSETFNVLLMRYGIERLLYRLTKSPHADAFILKGAMLFAIWTEKPYRPTQDLDLLGFGSPSPEAMEAVFREICVTDVEPDGLLFDPDSVTARLIREDNVYDGVRLRILAHLGTARLQLQVDVGFGDAVTPEPRMCPFGPLLDLPAPVVRAYAPETVIAEKLEAMLVLGLGNSRMKDYFDLWMLSETMAFEMQDLHSAVVSTIQRRKTALPNDVPVGLSESFGADATKQTQWAAFLRKMGRHEAPDLPVIVARLHEFLMPVIRTIGAESVEQCRWPPGGPWR